MRIVGLRKYRGRNPHGYFEDLPWEVRNRAYWWLDRFCTHWCSNLPSWRFAILVGQAKRLAWMSPEERRAWGLRMQARHGGLAAQRRYREEGRTGPNHPAIKAWKISAAKRKWRKQQAEDAERCKRLGLRPRLRMKRLPLFL